MYNATGVHTVADKVAMIHIVVCSTNVSLLKKFLAMAMYLGPFIAKLPCTDAEFVWNEMYTATFAKVKKFVCEDTTLCYLDTYKIVTLLVDASN